MTSRRYCFTIYDLDCAPTLVGDVRYIQWQLELCPKTERKHYQGWCQLKSPHRGSYIQKKWGCKFHFEKMGGSDDENAIYCSKDNTKLDGPWELGKRVKQGQRCDIEDMIADIKDNKKDIYIVENHGPTFLKYSRGAEKIKSIYQRQDKTFRNVQVEVLWGDAGSGKTRRAVESSDDYYILGDDGDGSVWFDGYDGEKTLILDDFYGWIKYPVILRMLDGYQNRQKIKGSFVYAKWTKVIITSNAPPEEWYAQGLTPALSRRISTITKCLNVTK